MRLKRVISATTAAVLALLGTVAVGVSATAEPEAMAWKTVVDPETHHEYPGAGGQDAAAWFNSTSHAGRVWTDKSVFDQTVTAKPGDENEGARPVVVEPGQLAVALSALGATRHVTSEIPTPIDVVLVLDVSGSMAFCTTSSGNCNTASTYQNSRAYAMAQAVNTAIDVILTDNPENRIALTRFSSGSGVMQSLGTPRVLSNSTGETPEYVRLEHSDQTTLRLRYVDDSGSEVRETITGGTNTQLGLYTGMNILATQTAAEVTGDNQRLPTWSCSPMASRRTRLRRRTGGRQELGTRDPARARTTATGSRRR